MKLIFRRSDALAEQHGKIEDLVLNPAGDVQFTGATLRDVARDGEPLAEMNRSTGHWYADTHEGADTDWIGPFTDIIITETA